MDIVTRQSDNNRKIPEAIFLENVDDLIVKQSVQKVMEGLQEAYNKYKFMEAQLIKQREAMHNKLPEIEKALLIVEHLQTRDEDEQIDFLLTDTIFAKAEIPKENKTVCLWLGANTMVEFTFEEARALLSANRDNAVTNLKAFDDDINYLKDQITTVEVNIARVYNTNLKYHEKKYNDLQDKKLQLETDLRTLEKSIYDLETKYLEETAQTGNILRGWEGYILTKNAKLNAVNNRKTKVNPQDRVFSASSKTSPFVFNFNDKFTIQEPRMEDEDKAPEFRPKRIKRKKNYANYKKEENNDITPQSSSEEFQDQPGKKVKGSKKF